MRKITPLIPVVKLIQYRNIAILREADLVRKIILLIRVVQLILYRNIAILRMEMVTINSGFKNLWEHQN